MIFYYLQQFPEETKARAEFILLTSIISVDNTHYC